MQISINLFLTQARGSHSYRLVKEATRLLIERKSRADDKRIGSLPANMYLRYELIAADQSINLPAKLDFGFVHKEYQSNESYRPKILENRDLPKELPPFPAFSKDIGRHFGEGTWTCRPECGSYFNFRNGRSISAFKPWSSVCGQLPLCCCLQSVGKFFTFHIFCSKFYFTLNLIDTAEVGLRPRAYGSLFDLALPLVCFCNLGFAGIKCAAIS